MANDKTIELRSQITWGILKANSVKNKDFDSATFYFFLSNIYSSFYMWGFPKLSLFSKRDLKHVLAHFLAYSPLAMQRL